MRRGLRREAEEGERGVQEGAEETVEEGERGVEEGTEGAEEGCKEGAEEGAKESWSLSSESYKQDNYRQSQGS